MLPILEYIIHLKINMEKVEKLTNILTEFAPKLKKCV